jgi:hypothetical protein
VQTHGPAAGKCTNWIGRVVKVRSVFLPTPNLKTGFPNATTYVDMCYNYNDMYISGGIVFVKSQSKGQKVLPENGERIIKKKWKDVSTTLFCPEQSIYFFILVYGFIK